LKKLEKRHGKRLPIREAGKGLLDANWILRYLLRDDEALFLGASALLDKVKTGDEKVIIPESVLAECTYILIKIYKVDRSTIAEKLCDFFDYKGVVNPGKKDLVDALLLFGHTNLSIVDCFLCAKSKNHGLSLFTFDKRLQRICSKGKRFA
jgi:predicted nucleic acid-binding protein